MGKFKHYHVPGLLLIRAVNKSQPFTGIKLYLQRGDKSHFEVKKCFGTDSLSVITSLLAAIKSNI